MSVDDPTLRTVVSEYTREAGVRQLERELGKVLPQDRDEARVGRGAGTGRRRRRRRPRCSRRQKFWQEAAERTAVPGVSTGLAVTGTGGDILFIEATRMKGKGELVLTGQLGDVMKESARIALSYVRSHASELGIDESAFDDTSFHVHVPAGAIPKDGPSAGIAMTTALASLLSEQAVTHGRHDRRGDAPRTRAADRRAEAEGARRARSGPAGRDPAGAKPRRPGRRSADVREELSFHPVMTLGEVLGSRSSPPAGHALAA